MAKWKHFWHRAGTVNHSRKRRVVLFSIPVSIWRHCGLPSKLFCYWWTPLPSALAQSDEKQLLFIHMPFHIHKTGGDVQTLLRIYITFTNVQSCPATFFQCITVSHNKIVCFCSGTLLLSAPKPPNCRNIIH